MKLEQKEMEQVAVMRNAMASIQVLAQMADRDYKRTMKELLELKGLDSGKSYNIKPDGTIVEITEKEAEKVADSEECKEIKEKIKEVKDGDKKTN